MASRIASSVGSAPEARNASPAMSIPGVQIPHWAPPVSRNACWSDVQPAGRGASPSTVRTSVPSTWQTGTRQLRTGSAVESTVHAPHSPSPQPSLVPVSAEVLAQEVEQAAHARRVGLDARRR